jgi:hypothetical protein
VGKRIRELATLDRAGSISLTQSSRGGTTEVDVMNLLVWLPAMFVLGLAALGVCLVFVTACERI